MTEQVWIELAKVFGLPIAGGLYLLRAGFKQVWVWGHEKVELVKANAELKAERDMYRDKYINVLLEMQKELRAKLGGVTP